MTGGLFILTDQKKLMSMRAAEFAKEDDFQSLLAENPELLSGEQINPESPRKWVLVAREKGIPSEAGGGTWWAVDHLFLDQDGIPTFVEVKRQSDTRLRREVVAQMLDYAANALTYWPADEIRRTFEKRFDASGQESAADQELSASLFPGSPAPLDIPAYWERVKTNLQAGRIRLLFVADKIPTELLRIVEFLNTQMDPAEVLALELRRYTVGGPTEGTGFQALVPFIYGRTEAAQQKKNAGLQGRSWTKDEFLDFLRQKQGDQAVEITQKIFSWASDSHAEVTYGSGIKYVSLGISFILNGQRVVLLRVWSSGSIEIAFGSLLHSPFHDETLRRELLNRLKGIPGTRFAEDAIWKYPTVPLKSLADESHQTALFGALSWAVKEGLINQFPLTATMPSSRDWRKMPRLTRYFPQFCPFAGQQAVFRTHVACQVRSNRSRTRNRLASAQVTNSRCAFLSSPR